LSKRRLPFLSDAADDVRQAVARARSRRQAPPPTPERETAAELQRRLDLTRERLRREIPPPDDGE
jgi:hypothetical protein